MENARTPKYIFNVRSVLWALKDVFRVQLEMHMISLGFGELQKLDIWVCSLLAF
jgi:hypothetical protein